MTPQEFLAQRSSGMDILEGFAGLRKNQIAELALAGDCLPGDIRPLVTCANAWAKAPQAQRDMVTSFSLTRLMIISRACNSINAPSREETDNVRLQLIQASTSLTCDGLKAKATELVRELNKDTFSNNRGVFVSKKADAQGNKQLILRDTAATINRINARLAELAPKTMDLCRGKGKAFADLAFSEGGEFKPTEYKPALILVLDKAFYAGKEAKVQTTTGEVYDLDELAQLALADTGWLTIVDKEAHILGNYEIERRRFANKNQRAANEIMQIVCPWPGCHELVMNGAAHHLISFACGGKTDSDTLSGICVSHNAQNDDFPDHPLNGHLERDSTGRVGYRPPGGGPLQYNDQPENRWCGYNLVRQVLEARRATPSPSDPDTTDPSG